MCCITTDWPAAWHSMPGAPTILLREVDFNPLPLWAVVSCQNDCTRAHPLILLDKTTQMKY